MKQPAYSPQEALERVKLMMGYDMSKTLTENRESIKEPINEVAPAFIAPLLPFLTNPWTAIPTVAIATGIWLYNVSGGGDSFEKTKKFFEGCSSLDSKMTPKQGKAEHREAADTIYNAIEGIGTGEDEIRAALTSMETVADLCAMKKYYAATYGDLYDDLDGDLDGESFRRYVWSAISPKVQDALEDAEKVKKEDCKQNPNQPHCKTISDDEKIRRAKACGHKTWEDYKASGWKCKKGGGGGGSSFKPCKGTYTYLCMADAIKTVQACLGLGADGKWGDKTQAKLKPLGYASFTDADIQKICTKKTDVEGETIDVSGEDKKISSSDTNF